MKLTFHSVLKKYLMPYQQKWLEDGSRFKMGMWSRQTGKSFATAAETVLDCLEHPGTRWVILSAGERQALEWMEKAKFWVRVFQKVTKFEVEYAELLNAADATQSKSDVRFENGSRISAIPANPDTARGYSCNVVLDEFAIHENPTEIWAAIFPSVTSPHGGLKKLRIVSTPKGRGNKFADLWEHNESYSTHKVTILDAVKQGLFGKVTDEELGVMNGGMESVLHSSLLTHSSSLAQLVELRDGLDDDDLWAQEYLCEFVDNTSVLLPYDLIGKCESETIKDDGASPLYIGMDVGRSKDLSVIVTAVKLGDVLAVTDVTELRKMPFADQLDILVSKGSASRVHGVRIDATGIGAMLAEEAAKRLGGKCQGVNFNVATKGEMYGQMRRRFEERSIRIPVARELREDLHAVQRVVSTGGNVTYSAPRNADGHSDRAAALALVIEAAKAQQWIAPVVASRRLDLEERTYW